jgi:NADPH2:quinone reductase
MDAVQIHAPEEGFTTVDRERPDPASEEVLIEVAACGVCGGDAAVVEGRDAIEYPRIPGHELAGTITETGAAVTEWAVGDRVAVGWHGGHCCSCPQCRRGAFATCEREHVTGLLGDGGYAEYATAAREALVPVPDGLDATAAGPLVCAGLTAYTALRDSDARPGDRVAVQGIGGVGHLGVQFADAFGFETVALSRGPDKRAAAFELGADHFVDTTADDPAAELQTLGGADAVLATAPSADAVASVVHGLAPTGEVIAVGAPSEPAEVDVAAMLGNRWSLRGWAAGHAGDARDALAAAVGNDVTPRVEPYPLADADEAFERMRAGETRFRAVLEP